MQTTNINMTPEHLEQIWDWNNTVPAPVEQRVCDLIEKRAQARPDAPAICAWDGQLTHGELSRLATKIASSLVDLGVKQDTFVPLMFDKSMWTTVALVGVLKAGGAFVLLDPSLPEQRLQGIITQLKASVVLTSTTHHEMASRLAQTPLVIDWNFFPTTGLDSLEDTNQQTMPNPATPDSLVYAVFTSGSTGVPKGVLITNTNAASALSYQTKNIGISENSRIFDFASYTFDVSVSNILSTLSAGGCLCVPSNEDRSNNLEQSIASMKATVIDITPSIAHVLSPERIPTVKTLIFGGEALHLRDVERWWGKVQIIHIYGPCECTPGSTINYGNDGAVNPEEAVHVGKGVGLVGWIVDPEDHNRLVPPGSPGELLLEGPLVGRGYLGDAAKTAEAFIRDPVWLLRGSSKHPGRRGRLYKTGDLMRYTKEGYLQYVGRKQATQVKIRGQRLELGEIESTLRNHAGVDDAVAVIYRQDGQEAHLVSFVTLRKAAVEERLEEPGENHVLGKKEKNKARDELYAMLKSQLPAFMVPQAIEVLDSMPLNRNGKIDRLGLVQGLKERRAALRDTGSVRRPTTEPQRQMQDIWARVLGLEASTIGLDHSFFQLGGSSISTMKLVTEARKVGMEITVADIFRHPVLHELLNQVRHEALVDQPWRSIAPFALLDVGGDIDAVLGDICSQYKLGHGDNRTDIILDAYPCTALQEGLMSLTDMNERSYIGQNILELSPEISVEKLRAAWEQAVQQLPILRTRIVQHDRLGLIQIVVDTPMHWIEADSLDAYLDSDIEQRMELGQPLARYALVKDGKGAPKWFVWTAHHAIYDGWSVPLVLNTVQSIARDEEVQQGPPFQTFIRYIKDRDEEMMDYWRRALDGCQCTPFPSLPPHTEQPSPDRSTQHSFPLSQSSHMGVTPNLMIRAAWALLVGGMNNTEDVVFGATLFGRNAPVAGIELMTGPTFATVPVRVKWDSSDKVMDYLNAVQEQATGMIPYEQVGLHKLAQLSPGARQACRFQSLMVVQPPANGSSDMFGLWRDELDRGSCQGTYGLMLTVQLGGDEVMVRAMFDSRMIDPWLVNRLLRRLEHVVSQLEKASPELSLSEVETTTAEDLQQMWKWNQAVPAATEQCVHHMIELNAQSQPDAPAVCAWDGEWTYGQLDDAATRLAHHLVGLGVGPGRLVTLCFEKSRWMPVAALAVMKAGGASVAIDSTQPEERLRTIVQQTGSKLALLLSSSANRELASHLTSQPVVVVDESLLDTPRPTHAAAAAAVNLPSVTPSDALYIAFTSGSTGVPKGAVVTHSNFSSAVHHVRTSGTTKFEPTARVYDFASYAFDMSWFSVLQSLSNGACLCIPSEADRRDDIVGSVQRLRVTYAVLTPSTAELLPAETIRKLQTLMLAGEALQPRLAKRLARLTHVINAYGPCECTPLATAAAIDDDTGVVVPGIGRGVGVNTWVVQVSDSNRLAPIGEVGELVLEGPTVGSGYLGDAEKTATAFIRDPAWLERGAPGHPGRQGRLYKTGDLVRYSPDGTLVFVGRREGSQVKIRGQRVELGEVEHYVQACIPSARQVIAEVIMPTDGEGQKRPTLAAFLAVDDQGGPSTAVQVMKVEPDVEHEIFKRLPVFMIPTVYFSLNKLPLNSSGKIDRRRLREVGSDFSLQQLVDLRDASSLGGNKRVPATETERTLQQIWARVLSIDPASIGADDSFLRLGGDSITAMQASAAARRVNLAMTTTDIMRNKTIAMLAESSSATQNRLLDDVDTSGAEEDSPIFDLSPIQRLYVTVQPDPKWCFDQSFFLKPRERISLTSLTKAIATIVSMHPMLRARFAQASPGRWKQRIVGDIHTSFHLCEVLSTGSISKSTKAGDVRRCRERLNIQTGPLLAAVLFDDSEGQSLFITAHHLVIDLVSWRIILEDLEGLLTGQQVPSAPGTSFRTWCSLQEQYAVNHLQSPEVASVSVQRPSTSSYWGLDMRENVQAATSTRQFVLDEACSAAIMGACNEVFNTRPVELMIAALVHSFSVVFVDRPTPTVFTEGHGREPWDDRIDLSRTVGWFTTIFPAFKPDGTTTVNLLDAIRQAKDCIRSLPKNGWSDFTCKFADEDKAASSASDFPVEVLLNFAGSYQQLERDGSFFETLAEAECSPPDSWSKLRRLALFELNGHMDRGRLAMSLDYPNGVHHRDLMAVWMDTFKAALTDLSRLLRDRPSEWTLSDFPMAFTSYTDIGEFKSAVMPQLGIASLQEIEDIYPCSGLQEGLLVAQGKSSGNYRVKLDFEIIATQAPGDYVDLARIERAWAEVVRRHGLLRAVLVDMMPGTNRTMHVILKNYTPSISYDHVADGEHGLSVKYNKYEPQHHLSLSRTDEKHANLCFEVSHAILDGHSTGVLIQDFWKAYDGSLRSDGPLYGDFIRYLETRPRDADGEFWVNYLDGVYPCLFPTLGSAAKEQTGDFTVVVPGLDGSGIHDFCSKWEVTAASVIQTAWALVLHHYTGSASPCFGNLASNRHVPVDRIGDMFGPLISMIPYRVHLGRDQSVLTTLREGQTSFLNSLSHQTPLMEIQEALDVGASGLFNTILSFQRDTKQPSQSADGHVIQERGGYDPVEVGIPNTLDQNEMV
ncbi:hypothetical protein GGS20DRAFT_123086 [Poronia punctata]|nr:hypothetical protein GGS20DRAFT_123086 [Poronia punctata]